MTAQKFDHPSLKVLVTGVSGTGKTQLFEKLVRAEKARVKFVFDHEGEFGPRFGLPVVVDMEGIYKACATGGWVVFDPLKMVDCEDAKGKRLGKHGVFKLYCDFVMDFGALVKGRKLFIADELQKIADGNRETEELVSLCDSGRRLQIDCFFISSAVNELHFSTRRQITQAYSFRQTDDTALAWLKSNGFDVDAIRELPDGKYVFKNLKTGESGSGGTAF